MINYRRMRATALVGGLTTVLVATLVAPVASAPGSPTLDWGEEAIEYYSDGVVLGYHKGEDAAVRILATNLCFNGEWVGTGKWAGTYNAAGSKYGDASVVRSAKGKTLTVTLPDGTAVYKRTTKKKAGKLWGTSKRAKKALRKCWWND